MKADSSDKAASSTDELKANSPDRAASSVAELGAVNLDKPASTEIEAVVNLNKAALSVAELAADSPDKAAASAVELDVSMDVKARVASTADNVAALCNDIKATDIKTEDRQAASNVTEASDTRAAELQTVSDDTEATDTKAAELETASDDTEATATTAADLQDETSASVTTATTPQATISDSDESIATTATDLQALYNSETVRAETEAKIASPEQDLKSISPDEAATTAADLRAVSVDKEVAAASNAAVQRAISKVTSPASPVFRGTVKATAALHCLEEVEAGGAKTKHAAFTCSDLSSALKGVTIPTVSSESVTGAIEAEADAAAEDATLVITQAGYCSAPTAIKSSTLTDLDEAIANGKIVGLNDILSLVKDSGNPTLSVCFRSLTADDKEHATDMIEEENEAVAYSFKKVESNSMLSIEQPVKQLNVESAKEPPKEICNAETVKDQNDDMQVVDDIEAFEEAIDETSGPSTTVEEARQDQCTGDVLMESSVNRVDNAKEAHEEMEYGIAGLKLPEHDTDGKDNSEDTNKENLVPDDCQSDQVKRISLSFT